MSDSNRPASIIVLEKLAAIETVAADCEKLFRKLNDSHRTYLAEFDQLKSDLIARINSFHMLASAVKEFATQAPPRTEPTEFDIGQPVTDAEEVTTAEEVTSDEDAVNNAAVPVDTPVVAEKRAAAREPRTEQKPPQVKIAPKYETVPPPTPPAATEPQKLWFREKYPLVAHLLNAAKLGQDLQKVETLDKGIRETLRHVIDAYKKVMAALKESDVDPKTGREFLDKDARTLVNVLTALDDCLAAWPGRSVEHVGKVQQVRNYLWSFVSEATNNEFKELRPPPNVNIQEWLRKNNYKKMFREYVERESSYGTNPPKDCVVRTLRPGYMQGDGDDARVIRPAKVQISSGPAPAQNANNF